MPCAFWFARFTTCCSQLPHHARSIATTLWSILVRKDCSGSWHWSSWSAWMMPTTLCFRCEHWKIPLLFGVLQGGYTAIIFWGAWCAITIYYTIKPLERSLLNGRREFVFFVFCGSCITPGKENHLPSSSILWFHVNLPGCTSSLGFTMGGWFFLA